MNEPLGPIGRACLRGLLGEERARRALADLADVYVRVVERRGPRAARRACFREALLLLLWAAVDRMRRLSEPRTRASGRASMLRDLTQDFRFALRGLARRPGFAAVAIVVLALGIGANVAIFTLADRLFLRAPALVEAPERLVRVFRAWGVPDVGGSLSYPDYLDYRDGNRTLSGLAAAGSFVATARVDEASTPVRVFTVTADWFDVLGIEPAVGRFFRPEENVTAGAHPVAVVTWGFWKDHLGGAQAVGREVTLNAQRFTIIGVVPRGYRGIGPADPVPDVFIPLLMRAAIAPAGDAAWRIRLPDSVERWVVAVGRLRPGVDLEAAQADLAGIAAGIRETYRGRPEDTVLVTPQFRWLPSTAARLKSLTRVLLIAVSLLLVSAAANVAILLIARASARRREIGIRTALGAARGRVSRLLLAESLLLGVAGFVCGLLVALVAGRVAASLFPFPLDFSLLPDGRMVAIAFGVSLLTALLVGIAPAWGASRSDVVGLIHGRGRTAGGTRVRDALVIVQIALSVVLVAGAMLFTRSLVAARTIDTGFDERGVLLVRTDLRNHGYDAVRGIAFVDDALRRLSGVAGVETASTTRRSPFNGDWSTDIEPWDGAAFADGSDRLTVGLNSVSAGYFDAMRVPILRGRALDASDRAGTEPVVVVNQTFARAVFGTEDVVGREVPLGEAGYRIVGVAANARYYAIDEEPWTQVYVSQGQRYGSDITFIVRTVGDPAALVTPVQNVLHEIDPSLAFTSVETLAAVLGRQIARYRASAHVVGLTGLIALVLASAGLYGVMAYRVTQRTLELGLRMALGASGRSIAGWVLSGGLRLTLAGIALGMVAAVALGRFVEGLLFNVPARDPVALTTGPLVLLAVAVIAILVPARRAMRVDPMRAMRAD